MTDERFLNLANRLNSLDMNEIIELENAHAQYEEEHSGLPYLSGSKLVLSWVQEEYRLLTGTGEERKLIREFRARQKERAKTARAAHEAQQASLAKRRVFVSVVVDDLDARGDARRSGRVAGYNATAGEVGTLLYLAKNIRERR